MMANENELQEVPLFEESLETSGEKYDVSLNKRPKINLTYELNKEFENPTEAEVDMKNETNWGFLRTHETERGIKKYFRCNKVKRRGTQCAASMYYLYDCSSDKVFKFIASNPHNHDELENQAHVCLSENLKAEIEKLFSMQLKPKAIMEALTNSSEQLPTKIQLNNYLSILRKSKYGPSKISVGELEKWLKEHSTIPDSNYEAYVKSYEISAEDTDIYFRFFITSTYFIELASRSHVVHADATYKLIWQGFPVIIVGTTDKDRHFHPFGLSVSTNEKKEDFKFVFNAVKEAVEIQHKISFQPNVLVCDAAKSIQNAFLEIFGSQSVVRMCWAHAKKNIVKHVDKLITKEHRIEILNDVDLIQLATSPEIFQRVSAMFLEKWSTYVDFCEYFKKEWIQLNPNWFEGVANGTQSTNNALEAFNRVIKDSNTLRERLSLGHFLTKAIDMVRSWSHEYEMELKKVFDKPSMTLNLWTKSYNWAKLPKKIIKKNGTSNTYRVPAKLLETVPENTAADWDTLEKYKDQLFESYEVILPTDSDKWLDGQCTCPAFFKINMCKHVVGLAIRLKYVSAPLEARNISIGEKRKRGSPSKSKKALLMQ
jgi:hypothetical protein